MGAGSSDGSDSAVHDVSGDRDGRDIAVVGAGLSGCLMAVLLARRGYRVRVFERRPDPRVRGGDHGRSINLGLSQRGITALRHAGLLDQVLAHAAPMRGRVVHLPDGSLGYHPYGTSDDQILRSVLRHDLNVILLDAAEAANVALHFGARLTDLDKGSDKGGDKGAGDTPVTLRFEDGTVVEAGTVIGADGAFSTVRARMQRGEPADYHQEFLPWGYKELAIAAGAVGDRRADPEALHVWPADDGLVVAHPNADRSLTGTIFLPLTGPGGFDALRTPEAVRALVTERFPDLTGLVPDVVAQFLSQPTGHLVTVRTSQWHWRGRVVLLGDACHAVYPFYGQGMNSAFEDCVTLDGCLERHPADHGAAFAAYQAIRKVDTDVLADLSAANFVELRDRLSSPLFLARKRADLALNRLLGRRWVPLYTMIAHTTTPYAEALRRSRRQNTTLGWLAGATATAAAAAGTLLVRHLSRQGK
ncbi:NAD(P)/FAD-dependent oxidoreductase [Actinokineospora sp. NBRC 105648]|uniref:FAD-dependent oxidoreductase n=1 Tax=Actinokineospora sp. NBRC 105648 TaxID=3032206 RepID=UPI00249FDF98|nr:NAD(P)/FAD-dependent oxidoreductase [Actinokineospora sp. NBRC 105648]GLZ38037.1 kynurenine 3-monooxygenase [Actinokineospora sp. NBRC 105648]